MSSIRMVSNIGLRMFNISFRHIWHIMWPYVTEKGGSACCLYHDADKFSALSKYSYNNPTHLPFFSNIYHATCIN